MATYVREATRGRTLHLLKLPKSFNDTAVYIDVTARVKDAEKADAKAGYSNGGPRFASEIMKASDYADYVSSYATSENLHQFNCSGYMFFTEKPKVAAPPRGKGPKSNVRSNVSK